MALEIVFIHPISSGKTIQHVILSHGFVCIEKSHVPLNQHDFPL